MSAVLCTDAPCYTPSVCGLLKDYQELGEEKQELLQ